MRRQIANHEHRCSLHAIQHVRLITYETRGPTVGSARKNPVSLARGRRSCGQGGIVLRSVPVPLGRLRTLPSTPSVCFLLSDASTSRNAGNLAGP